MKSTSEEGIAGKDDLVKLPPFFVAHSNRAVRVVSIVEQTAVMLDEREQSQ